MSFMVSNSDKGGVTIISKKEDYFQKIRTMLADIESFTLLATDPTKTVKNKVNGILDKLYHANIIADKLFILFQFNSAFFLLHRRKMLKLIFEGMSQKDTYNCAKSL